MVIDTDKHRAIILELIRTSNIPGEAIDDVYDLKIAVLEAGIDKSKVDSDNKS